MNKLTYISFLSCIYSLIIEIGEIILQEHQSGSPMKQGTSPLKQGTPLKKHGSYLERQPVLSIQTFIYIFLTKLHKWSLMYLMYHSFLIFFLMWLFMEHCVIYSLPFFVNYPLVTTNASYFCSLTGESWSTCKLCGAQSWSCSWKANCCCNYIQVLSSLEVLWSRQNKCIWPGDTNDWFCFWGMPLHLFVLF